MVDITASPTWQQSGDKLTAEVRKIVLDVSGLAFRDFLFNLNDKLVSFGEKSCAGSDLADLYYARANIRADHSRIVRLFVRRLEASFNRRWSFTADRPGANAGRQGVGDHLALVEDEVLEEHLALAAVRQKAEALFSDHLWALSLRFALLQGGAKTPADKLPVAPASYCEALQDAFSIINISLASKLYIYKLFDRWWPPQMEGIYQRINTLLKNRGVLPNLRLQLHNSATGSAGVEPLRIADQARRTQVDYQKLLNEIEQLQSHLIEQPLEPSPYTTEQLLQAAEQLQQSYRSRVEKLIAVGEKIPLQDISADKERLGFQLQQVLAAESLPQLNSRDLKTMDLVDMLFEYMRNDDQLPDRVKAALSFLHTPYLKIAFADPGFFRQHQHPARQLLNVLADAGVRWVADETSKDFDVYAQIQQVVWRILAEYGRDLKLFASLLMEFNGYLQKIELRVHLLERRAAEKARGEDRLRQVKLRVNQEIQQRLQVREPPAPLMLLLLQPWTDYMVLLLLRYGDESHRWEQALKLVDELMRGLDISTESELAHWQRQYPQLKASLQQGLDMVGYDSGKAERLMHAIEQLYRQPASNDDPRGGNPELQKKLVRLAERRLTAVSVEEPSERCEQDLLQQLCQMEFGSWFQFKDGRREKVAWHNAATAQFLFVDQGCKRTQMRSGLEIARAMIAGEMRMIVDPTKPLIERTLEMIHRDLNNQANNHVTV